MIGLNAYATQLAQGLAITGMGDEVSWGLYIANFVFLVGMAAAAVMLVIPAYIFDDKDIHKVVIMAELFAVSALIMCLLFITIDVGRPDRLWHMIPFIGVFNWPSSILTWDFLVLNGYLAINLFLVFYYLSAKYKGKELNKKYYLPVVFLSIIWAPSIHTVTGFLFQGLVGRSFWHTGLIAPRFLASAFSAGPAFILIVFIYLKGKALTDISQKALDRLRVIVTVSLIINLIFLVSEIFSEIYHPSEHAINMQILLGLKGDSYISIFFWIAISLVSVALVILMSKLRFNNKMLIFAYSFIVIGIWIEKGLGFLIPAFIPSTLGDFIQYIPTLNEILIVIGVWATGLLIYSILLKISLPIINGKVSK
jgi:molybdopterin-containing oxidoreductase family membrane subunit